MKAFATIISIVALGALFIVMPLVSMITVDAQQLYQTPIAVELDNTSPVSDQVMIAGKYIVGIQMPASWTTANLTFQGSYDCSTYQNIYDEYGTEFNITAAASRFIKVDPADFAGPLCIKIRSGTAGTPVTQTVTPTLQIMYRDL